MTETPVETAQPLYDYESHPVRYCHGCDTFDRAPRVRGIASQNNPEGDGLYHYDCASQETLDALHPDVRAAAASAYAEGRKDETLLAVLAPVILAASAQDALESNHHTATGLDRNEG